MFRKALDLNATVADELDYHLITLAWLSLHTGAALMDAQEFRRMCEAIGLDLRSRSQRDH